EARRIHLWDLARLERSVVLSGQDQEQGPPLYHTHTPDGQGVVTHTITFPHPSATPAQNRGQSRSMLTAQHHQTVMKGHSDAISALACIDLPFKGGIVSGDASGALKVFKMD
ncbi:hypothetical protein RSAG8_04226, partial [Rhizoctonia solani AG-8 WAC10335]